MRSAAHLRKRLAEAIAAMEAVLAPDAGADEDTRRQLAAEADLAVSLAVSAGCAHSAIASAARCSGLRVIDHIKDPPDRCRALAAEAQAAVRYQALVVERMKADAAWRYNLLVRAGVDTVAHIAEDLGVTRKTIYTWLQEQGITATREGTGHTMTRAQYQAAFRAEATHLRTFAIAYAWFRLDLGGSRRVPPHEAAQWANAGFEPAEARPWILAGTPPERAVKAE